MAGGLQIPPGDIPGIKGSRRLSDAELSLERPSPRLGSQSDQELMVRQRRARKPFLLGARIGPNISLPRGLHQDQPNYMSLTSKGFLLMPPFDPRANRAVQANVFKSITGARLCLMRIALARTAKLGRCWQKPKLISSTR